LAAISVTGCEVKNILNTPFKIALASPIYGIALAGTNEMNCGRASTKRIKLMMFNQTVLELKTDFI